jgi:hypothetical protein
MCVEICFKKHDANTNACFFNSALFSGFEIDADSAQFSAFEIDTDSARFSNFEINCAMFRF